MIPHNFGARNFMGSTDPFIYQKPSPRAQDAYLRKRDDYISKQPGDPHSTYVSACEAAEPTDERSLRSHTPGEAQSCSWGPQGRTRVLSFFISSLISSRALNTGDRY